MAASATNRSGIFAPQYYLKRVSIENARKATPPRPGNWRAQSPTGSARFSTEFRRGYVGFLRIDMMCVDIFSFIVTKLACTATIFLALLSLELALPMDRNLSTLRHLRSTLFWVMSVPVAAAIFYGFSLAWRTLGVPPLVDIALDSLLGSSWAGLALASLVSLIVADFWFYWFHRIQHAVLWRQHATHHSIRNVSVLSSYHHLSEELVRVVLVAIPTSLLVIETGDRPFWIGLALAGWGFYVHTNTRLHLPWLRWLVVDPCFHRIHHSTQPEHFGRNFGAFTTLWDRVFGTAYFPKAGEWPQTGLSDITEPESVGEWITLPLRYKPAAAAVAG